VLHNPTHVIRAHSYPPDVKRRRYLLAVAGAVGAGAGCLGTDGDGASGGEGSPGGAGTTTASGPGGESGGGAADAPRSPAPPNPSDVELPVPKRDLVRGAREDAIPAITDPAFAKDWSDTEYSLSADSEVIGVSRGGTARAYPLAVLDYHEIVNDHLDGPLLVTYCPLCGSGMTAERRVRGEETTFGVSGFLYRSDLVMYDRLTDSLWSQIMATAINGEMTGETLTLVPSSLTTWGSWRRDNPDTEVLLPPPDSGTITNARPAGYEYEAYAGYDESERIGIGYNSFDDDRLHPKARVIGIQSGEVAVAYPFGAVSEEGVVNDRVGELPVVVVAGPSESLYAYDRRVDGEVLEFSVAGDGRIAAGGSEWAVTTGEAVSGPHEGRRLGAASGATRMFWFAWLDFSPETTVYGSG
jgi:hypothetical protein